MFSEKRRHGSSKSVQSLRTRLDKLNATAHVRINVHDLGIDRRLALLGKEQEELAARTRTRRHSSHQVTTPKTQVGYAGRGLGSCRIYPLSVEITPHTGPKSALFHGRFPRAEATTEAVQTVFSA